MLEFLHQFLARAAVMVPVMLLLCAATWFMMARLGALKLDQPLIASDLRTWPLSLALADAFLFAVAYAAIMALAGDNQLGAALGGGFAALIALGLVPAMTTILNK